MRKLFWVGTFGLGIILTFTASFLTLAHISPQSIPRVLSAQTDSDTSDIETLSEITSAVTTSDSREIIIRNYLKKYKSPLEPFAKTIVETSDKYGLDYRLLVAIARQESNLCKKIPENSFNCWGFGIYGDKVTRFDNYPQAFDIVARTLKKNYIDKGLDTPEKIMAKYTPPSVSIGGPWAKGVNQFLTDLE